MIFKVSSKQTILCIEKDTKFIFIPLLTASKPFLLDSQLVLAFLLGAILQPCLCMYVFFRNFSQDQDTSCGFMLYYSSPEIMATKPFASIAQDPKPVSVIVVVRYDLFW